MTKTKILRVVMPALVILVVVSGVAGFIRYGGMCTVIIQQMIAVCPLGYLERALAAGEFLPLFWIPVALGVFSVILVGRIFCAWVCPVVLVRRIFKGNGTRNPKHETIIKEAGWTSYSSYAVLGGVLLASLLFRFPVFCLFCPIGLFFGSVFAVVRLFSPDPLSLDVVVFPVFLGLELWALKSWCRSFCPLGALLSIIGNFNPFFRPAIMQESCLASKGINCQACYNACPEGIDLRNHNRIFTPNSCTKCLECSDRCPAKAIKFPLWARKSRPREVATRLAHPQ